MFRDPLSREEPGMPPCSPLALLSVLVVAGGHPAGPVAPGSRTAGPSSPAGPGTPGVTVEVDSAHHEVVITSGPWSLPNQPPMDDHAMMTQMEMAHDAPVQRFEWPVEGWFRGFKYQLVDGAGRPVPRQVMHHMIVVNFDRRQLVYHAVERLMGAGSETEDAAVPKTIG